ncbi:STAS domain-containing protein [Streptomyces sp. NPDC094447]|uniref:STAS domain-containing protein n=1 Tax=Streptomyces sp. NPDC094447 TaxID=3366062 RepID=UPI003811787C
MTQNRSPSSATLRPPAVAALPQERRDDGEAFVVREAASGCGTVVLTLVGSFGVSTVACLHEALSEARLDRAPHTVLDLAGVTFGDSALLHELLTAHFSHRDLLLLGPVPRHLHHLFLRTGTLRLFAFVPDRRSLPWEREPRIAGIAADIVGYARKDTALFPTRAGETPP